MPKITSSISTSSEEFKANAAAMRALVADLADKRAEAAAGGPDKLRERHVARGKLLPRDRVLGSSIRARRSWSSRRSPRSASTPATSTPPASSRAWGASRAASA